MEEQQQKGMPAPRSGHVLAFLLALHLVALVRFFPPTEVFRSRPLLAVDYPVHTYRVHVFREGLRTEGVPWGYDPAVSGGTVMNPGQDLGAKAMEILSVPLWFLAPGTVVRLFLFLTLIAYPLLLMAACRTLGLSQDQVNWVILVGLAATWLPTQFLEFLQAGLVTFYLSAFFAVLVAALFVGFVRNPGAGRYVGVVLSSTALFLIHVTGPVVIAPALAVVALASRSLTWRWKTLLACVPVAVLVLNAFWFVPYLLANDIPVSSGSPKAYPADTVFHLTFASLNELVVLIVEPAVLTAILGGIALTAIGWRPLTERTGRLEGTVIGVAIATGITLAFGASFVPGFRSLQPVRFIVPTLAFMALPVGVGCWRLSERLRSPHAATVLAAAGLLSLAALLLGRPAPLGTDSVDAGLESFIISHTDVADRLLIQSPDGYNYGDYETKAFPMMFGREVIGSNFSLIYDPPQFLSTMLFGQRIQDWSPDTLRATLSRWGVSRVFTVSSEAERLLSETLVDSGMKVGAYRVFHVADNVSRLLRGEGSVSATVNEIRIDDLSADDSVAVLRYRYHPAWRADQGVVVCSFAVPEDPQGFIALVDPPSSVRLTFDPWALFETPWPDRTGERSLACPESNN